MEGSSSDDLLSMIFLIPALVMLVIFSVEFLLLLLPLAVVARIIWGVAWEVEIRLRRGMVWPVIHTESVRGWAELGTTIRDLAVALENGSLRQPLPPKKGRDES